MKTKWKDNLAETSRLCNTELHGLQTDRIHIWHQYWSKLNTLKTTVFNEFLLMFAMLVGREYVYKSMQMLLTKPCGRLRIFPFLLA